MTPGPTDETPDEHNIMAQWAKVDKEKRQNAMLLQQGNVRYQPSNIDSKTHATEDTFKNENNDFQFDAAIPSL